MTSENQTKKSGGALWGVVLLFLGIVATALVLTVGSAVNMSGLSQLVVSGFGVLLMLVGGIVIIISRLYVRTRPDGSFVRTGQGGQVAVINGGALVIPVVHEIQWVSHETMKLVVERRGSDALITGDNLRADLVAEFYIRVPKDETSVVAAAASLGNRGINPQAVKELMMEKLVSALRTVASSQKLMELHQNRKTFAEGVQEIVSTALQSNGLTLEDVTISQLDQTRLAEMAADDNIFDAQGARAITEITAQQRIERNRLEREADVQVTTQNVTTRKTVLEKEREQAEAEAENRRKIAEANAVADNQAEVKKAEETQKAEVAEVARQRAVEVANVERQRDIDVAEQRRQRATQEAEIERTQAVEVASRNAKIAVEERETARAKAEAERLEAEAEAELNRQKVKTVEVTESAERDKRKALIDNQAEIEKAAEKRRVDADAEAYAVVKTAEGQQEAAERSAAAIRTAAEAERDAEKAKAEGKRAVEMIPVEVDRERVAVRREELANENEFAAIASDLKARLLTIEANRDVDIQRAKSMGEALSKAEMRFWGDPTTFKAMSGAFLNGQVVGMNIEGVVEGTPIEVKNLAGDAVRSLGSVAAGLVKKFTGQDVSGDTAMELVKQFLGEKTPEEIVEILKGVIAESAETTSAETAGKTSGRSGNSAEQHT